MKEVVHYDPRKVVEGLCNRRMAYLRRLRIFEDFGRGWTRRVMGQKEGAQDDDIGVIDRAHRMALNLPVTAPKKPAQGKGEGRPSLWRWVAGLFS